MTPTDFPEICAAATGARSLQLTQRAEFCWQVKVDLSWINLGSDWASL